MRGARSIEIQETAGQMLGGLMLSPDLGIYHSDATIDRYRNWRDRTEPAAFTM